MPLSTQKIKNSKNLEEINNKLRVEFFKSRRVKTWKANDSVFISHEAIGTQDT